MKTKIMATYSVSMRGQARSDVKFPECTIIMSYRSIQ